MNRTYTPGLKPDVLDRLAEYAASFRDDFNRPRQAAWCGTYLRGLIQDGDRKSVEPMAARLPLPEGLEVSDSDQALQQFLGQSTWDEQVVLKRYRATMARRFADPQAIFVIDDTTFPKQGKHSVGVQRQYCGALGKKADCQCAVSVHYVAPRGHYPLAMRLYLPESWLGDPKRLDRAHVPEAERRALTRGQIALELLDRVRGEGLPGGLVVADSGYGVSGPFPEGLAGRGLHYIVGVTDEMLVFTEPPRWIAPTASTGGRPRKRHRLAEDSHRPSALPQPHRPDPAGPARQVREVVLDLAVGLLLDQHPHQLGPGAPAGGPAAAGPDPQPGEPPGQLALDPLAPGHLPQRRRGGHRLQANRAWHLVLKRGRLRGRPPDFDRRAAGAGNSHDGSSVKTTISSVTPAM